MKNRERILTTWNEHASFNKEGFCENGHLALSILFLAVLTCTPNIPS